MPDLSCPTEISHESPFTLDEGKKWYAIYVRSRHEIKVAEQLKQKGITHLVPMVKEIRQWSDRKKKVKVPLFRGYVFVNIDLSKEKFSVLQNDGVVKFIGIKGVPSMIPQHEIRWLNILNENTETVKYETDIQVGESVSVVAGPFKGIQGEVIEVRNTSRLVISFESISQIISIEIAPDLLKKIS
ncbi:MAG: UpxY family transcription antiterminator [Fidelibacterota bacterium]